MPTEFDDFREFKVTTKEVWRDMQDFRRVQQEENSIVREMLSTINSKLDVLTVTATHTAKSIDDHEKRIRDIEKSFWKAAGVVAFLGIAAGFLVNFIQ